MGRTLDFGSIGQAVAGRFPPEAVEALEGRDDVRYVEVDGTVQALGQSLPWGIDRVDADAARGPVGGEWARAFYAEAFGDHEG